MAKETNLENNENLDLPFVDENDDITEYIQNQSFNALIRRFGSAEEDESIRNEDFNPLVVGKMPKKSDAEETYQSHIEELIVPEPETPIPLQSKFGLTESAFDNDSISFDEIDIDSSKKEEEPVTETKKQINGFNTNTRVVYVDKSVDDEIKRNSDTEVSSVFSPEG